MSKVELLAPAGSPEGVRAAVQSGAGAVYMGFGTFNARRNAQGFTADEMADAIAYCRARNVKTNITLNILAGDRELDAALADAKFLYEAGADALIVQDLGLARLIHAHAPDFALHASTQMTIHTLDGARQARDLGFSRVVLSRECTRDEVRLITEKAGVETEVFVHGALCMCYSGQCYLSAVIGQRSGNRGLCAQPCRLPYSGGYPLSLKDLALAGHVAELADLGVSSLKIEGRMKRPEYTAIVTKIYADLLREHRGPTPEERDTLRRVFSRDGFTDGYYTGKKGDGMFGTKTDVPLHEVQSLYDEAARRFAEGKEAPLVPVSLCFTAREDTGAVLSADGVSSAAAVERARTRPTTPEMVEKSLRKTGGTPFYVNHLRIEIADGLAIPASTVNAMRRDALALLLAKRATPPSRDWLDGPMLARDDDNRPRTGFHGYTASVRTREQADALRGLGLETIYVPLDVAVQTGLPVILPRVFSDEEQGKIEMLLGEAMSRGTRVVLAGNLGQIAMARRLGFTVRGDFGLNAFNSKTLHALAEMGVQRQTLSFEARLAQIRDMRGPLETEMIVYGHLPLMIFENCAIRRQHGGKCACQNGVTYLTDRRGERFALLPEYGCRNTLLGNRALCLREDVRPLGVQTARLLFTTETPDECARIACAFMEGAPLDGEFTNGLYKRGVE
ncbi:MAG TPA: U32 family peptidase [Candidatus Agathobaculum merdavium]|nr:U32 family peptidase [Candidatus Agathobaculum merdavium]